MNRQDIEKTLGRQGDLLTITQIADAMNLDRGTVRRMLFGINYLPCGRKKLFHIKDVSERLIERTRT